MSSTSAIPIFLITILYYRIVKHEGPKFMENRTAWKLKSYTRLFNICQVAACTYLVVEFYRLGFTLRSTFSSCDNFTMDTYKPNADLCWWLFILKASNLIETVAFVMRKKNNQITTAHVFHHMGTFVFSWVFLKYAFQKFFLFLVVLNTMVHIVTYTYYCLSTFRQCKSFLKAVKPYLSGMQLIEMVILFVRESLSCYQECEQPLIIRVVFLTFGVALLTLFTLLFKQLFMNKNTKNDN